MNKLKSIANSLSNNRGVIIRRTLIIGVSVVGVTLAAGLLSKKEIPIEIIEEVIA